MLTPIEQRISWPIEKAWHSTDTPTSKLQAATVVHGMIAQALPISYKPDCYRFWKTKEFFHPRHRERPRCYSYTKVVGIQDLQTNSPQKQALCCQPALAAQQRQPPPCACGAVSGVWVMSTLSWTSGPLSVLSQSPGVFRMRSTTSWNACWTPTLSFADASTKRASMLLAKAWPSDVGTWREDSCVVRESWYGLVQMSTPKHVYNQRLLAS